VGENVGGGGGVNFLKSRRYRHQTARHRIPVDCKVRRYRCEGPVFFQHQVSVFATLTFSSKIYEAVLW
jgi:hypothetical protein